MMSDKQPLEVSPVPTCLWNTARWGWPRSGQKPPTESAWLSALSSCSDNCRGGKLILHMDLSITEKQQPPCVDISDTFTIWSLQPRGHS